MMNHAVELGMFVRVREAVAPRGTLLFVHGLGESGLCFEALATRPELAGWRMLVPDLPGYGRSPWPEQPLALEDQADLLAVWLRGREEEPVVVVGHSMGSVTGLLLAEGHPTLVRGLCDVDGNKSPPDCAFSGPVAESDPERFAAHGFDALRDQVYRDGLRDDALRGYYASLRLCDPRVFHRNSRELVALSARSDLATRLAALPVPRHYIAGVPGGAAELSLRLLEEAGVPWTGVGPSGHWPFIDQPARFCAALLAFLGTV